MPSRIKWHLTERMALRNMDEEELARRLAAVGVQRSRTQLWRLPNTEPRRISFELLAGLCDALSCAPGDLLSLVPAWKSDKRSRPAPPPPTVRFGPP